MNKAEKDDETKMKCDEERKQKSEEEDAEVQKDEGECGGGRTKARRGRRRSRGRTKR